MCVESCCTNDVSLAANRVHRVDNLPMISARKNENDMAIAIESLVVRLMLHAVIFAKEFYEKEVLSS